MRFRVDCGFCENRLNLDNPFFIPDISNNISAPMTLAIPGSPKMEMNGSPSNYDIWEQTKRSLYQRNLITSDMSAGCAVANSSNVLIGRIAAYINTGGGTFWDLGAAGLCISEAGGVALDLDTKKPVLWNKLVKKTIFASNRAQTDRILNAISKL